VSRYTESKATIAEVHARLPADITLAERKKAIFAAYPFGERNYHPYKMWLKAQREYFANLENPGFDPSKNWACKVAADMGEWKHRLASEGYSFGGIA
jgi:hypothetical protein